MPPDSEDESSTLQPDDAFTVLGNETRIEILRALWEAHDPYAPDDAVPFSELYDRVGYGDTGNFNYHLSKLTGHFVRRTETGYELARPGLEVVQAIVAGRPTEDPTLEPAPVDATCMRCEGPVEITYEGGTVWALCTECEGYWPQREGALVGFGLHAAGLRDRSPDEILEATFVYSLKEFEMMDEGVCPACSGTVVASLSVCEEHGGDDGRCDACGLPFLGVVTFTCRSCKKAFRAPSWASVQHHPALVSFYYERGIEHVHSSWEAARRGFGWREELASTDPPAVRITAAHAGDEIRFTVDETGSVRDVEE